VYYTSVATDGPYDLWQTIYNMLTERQCWWCCSGHGRHGIGWTVNALVTPINCPDHTHYSWATAPHSWPMIDGASVVCVRRRLSVDARSAAAPHAPVHELSHYSVPHVTSQSAVTSCSTSSSSALVTTTVFLEKCEAAMWQRHYCCLICLP